MAASTSCSDYSAAVDLCKFCLQKISKYVCPRCGTPYCSVGCYRSEDHLDCSESFYQEWVESQLKGSTVAPDGKRKMMEILEKMLKEEDFEDEELDSDDEPNLVDLSERLAGIDLDDSDAVWDKLSEAEKSAFRDLVKSSDITNLIPNWDPWWNIKLVKSKVVVVGDDTDFQVKLKEIQEKCPSVCDQIYPLSQITTIKPSATVALDFVNILGSYTLTVRYFNGEHFDFQEEAATIIYNLSKSLSIPQKFESITAALESVAFEAFSCTAIESTQEDIEMMKVDVKKILAGPVEGNKLYMLSALSDMHKVFSFNRKTPKAKRKFASQFRIADLEIELIKKEVCRKTLKRLKYFLSWVVEYGDYKDFSAS